MTEVERHAHGGIFRQSALAPARFLRDKLKDPAHARSVKEKCRRSWLTAASRSCGIKRGRIEQREAELYGIFSSGMCKLVDEGLHHERDSVAAGSAHRARRDAHRNQRNVRGEVRDEAGGEFVRRNSRGGKIGRAHV